MIGVHGILLAPVLCIVASLSAADLSLSYGEGWLVEDGVGVVVARTFLFIQRHWNSMASFLIERNLLFHRNIKVPFCTTKQTW